MILSIQPITDLNRWQIITWAGGYSETLCINFSIKVIFDFAKKYLLGSWIALVTLSNVNVIYKR